MDAETINVLVVEDESSNARLVEKFLARAPGGTFTSELADRLSTGLERLAQGGINVVLLDLGFPDSSGIDTLKAVRENAPDVPIVVLTALDDDAVATEAMRGGTQDYLS